MSQRIPPALFTFLRDLAAHNERPWFQAHKADYEAHVREPLLRLIVDMAPRLHRISAHVMADPRPTGGSMLRIYRNLRFSKDKRPYNTFAGAHFRHQAGSDSAAPGYYVNLQPGQSYLAAGLWQPPPAVLARVRQAILDDPAAWRRAVGGPAFRKLAWAGASLQRAPKGVDPGHPLIEHLRRKSFAVSQPFTDRQVCAPDFPAALARACRTMAPLLKFLARALDLPF